METIKRNNRIQRSESYTSDPSGSSLCHNKDENNCVTEFSISRVTFQIPTLRTETRLDPYKSAPFGEHRDASVAIGCEVKMDITVEHITSRQYFMRRVFDNLFRFETKLPTYSNKLHIEVYPETRILKK
ncbi:hypothetical protein CLF_102858 [Clonorchis sinensis]|uniref:Uncharacterized protein n=1 Tax=Clonorchis sinensis TaxID=79923 RepID=G7YN77_CLOSI|nr:hypothetical protein CLF_102858 [Clonorchis sinensis]